MHINKVWAWIGAASLLIGLIGGCSLLLPKRFSINVPVMNALLGWGTRVTPEDELRQRLELPDGYQINIYADNIAQARLMRWTQGGDLLVSTPRSGEIKLIARDANGDGRADSIRVLVSDLNRPHGLELYDGWLYIAETDAIARIRFDEATGAVSGGIERILTGLPAGGNHWSRTLHLGPDGNMYVSVGSSCNACIENDPRRAALLRFNPDGPPGETGEEIYATGLRNTVGFDWQPGTGNLYGVDNGRDLLGDDIPPEELNLIEQGKFYGWPFLYGMNIPDPDFGIIPDPRLADALMPPAHVFPAHTAPLSVHFIRNPDPVPGLKDAALVTLHGSWNRSEKHGYEIVSLHWTASGAIEQRPFLSGFEIDEDVIGRPVDVNQGPDGALYVSDNYAGAIYRIAYGDKRAPSAPASNTGSAPMPATETSQDAAAIARGAQLWAENACASCHAPQATEDAAVAELKQIAHRYTAGELAALLTAPPANMPAVALSDTQKADLAAYLRATYN